MLFRDVGNFVRHLCVLVLRHQMLVSNYFVNSFYSVYIPFTRKEMKQETFANCDGAGLELPPLWFELRIFRLPGKGGYYTRPLGTTSSLIVLVVTICCIRHKTLIFYVLVYVQNKRYVQEDNFI
jgi:hypothetical protein